MLLLRISGFETLKNFSSCHHDGCSSRSSQIISELQPEEWKGAQRSLDCLDMMNQQCVSGGDGNDEDVPWFLLENQQQSPPPPPQADEDNKAPLPVAHHHPYDDRDSEAYVQKLMKDLLLTPSFEGE